MPDAVPMCTAHYRCQAAAAASNLTNMIHGTLCQSLGPGLRKLQFQVVITRDFSSAERISW